ncbi:NAD(P)-binding protein [Qipengyuania flava]|uniref:NAD(P)-binding protein n=1 Tax=Qipengyuania flava TaxID=192812 RepID=UPI001C62D74E|nr:NAD(P)-binding protein [Qipengyuania flava]QYJ07655.1 NAD(P)-binding protein [Qipengyuania flava]
MERAQTDYLIIGAGAVGLTFADTLLAEDPEAHVTFVDKHAKPGGHWNDAYSFVALHQPSTSYGVNSLAFPGEHVDSTGHNAGMLALASGPDVLAYFERVMDTVLMPTGRVTYYPLSEYRGDGRIVQLLSGEETHVEIRRREVDGTFYQTSVPSTHTRNFAVADGVRIEPPGALPGLWMQTDNLPAHYVVLGAGKTAMDTVIWLLEAGVPESAVSWVRPRESWLINRSRVQPGEAGFDKAMDWQIAHFKSAIGAKDGAEMLRLMGEDGHFLRIDENIEPEMFHYATISEGEIDILRRVTNVIRAGRVQRIDPGKLVFAGETVDVPENTLFVDCTASAVPFEARQQRSPVFTQDRIVLQPLHVPLVTLSAAVAAYLEVHGKDDAERNALATPGPLTDTPQTYPYAYMTTMANRRAWSQHSGLAAFLAQSRVDPMGPTLAALMAKQSPLLARMAEMGEWAQKATPDLMRLGMQAAALHEKTS